MLEPGRHPLPGDLGRAYSCEVSRDGPALIATLVRDGDVPRPVVCFGVAPDDEAAGRLWPALERMYLEITERPGFRSADFAAPARPAATPWCAAMTVALSGREAAWAGDFERCLAWAWIAAASERT